MQTAHHQLNHNYDSTSRENETMVQRFNSKERKNLPTNYRLPQPTPSRQQPSKVGRSHLIYASYVEITFNRLFAVSSISSTIESRMTDTMTMLTISMWVAVTTPINCKRKFKNAIKKIKAPAKRSRCSIRQCSTFVSSEISRAFGHLV